jgi:hypothetical protein
MLTAMQTIETFLKVVERFVQASGLAETTLSSRLFNAGHRISQIRAGSDIGVRRLSEALQWLSDNWPGDALWPEDVARPLPASASEDAPDSAATMIAAHFGAP